jgi:hypothetical protein
MAVSKDLKDKARMTRDEGELVISIRSGTLAQN